MLRGGARHPIFELTSVRVREFLREPEAVFWVFAFPILMACALGIAFRNRGPERVYVGVEDGPAAQAVVAPLTTSQNVNVRVLPPDQVETALRKGDVQIVVIPGTPPTYRFDPTRTESRLARMTIDDVLQRASGRSDRWAARTEEVVAEGSRYIDWLVPGLLGMNIMSTGLWSVSFSIVQSRTRKLLKRLIATPMRKSDYLLSHALGRLVFLGLEVSALLFFARFAFHVPMRGSILTLAAIAFLGAASFGGIGLLVASRARTVEAVSGLLNVVMLPMWLLSGVFFSSSNFPEAMQPFIRALPLTALNEALRGVMLDGASIAGIARQSAVLALWGALAFGVALKIFRWR
jgi:ABC transporter DrrB family efflux protein